jgi:hypothetical protein
MCRPLSAGEREEARAARGAALLLVVPRAAPEAQSDTEAGHDTTGGPGEPAGAGLVSPRRRGGTAAGSPSPRPEAEASIDPSDPIRTV